MINGKIRGVAFEFDDGEITSKDEELEETLKEMFKLLLVDYELKDGLPELIFLEKLKKFGAKDLKYTPTDEEYDFIQLKEDVVGDEFKPGDHPRNKLGMFIKKIGDILFSKKDKKEESNNLSGDYIANVYLSETGDLNYGLPTKKEIRGFLEKEELPNNLEDLDKLYDDTDLLNEEYYLKGDLTKYAIEYKKSLIVDKIKRLNKEKEDLMGAVLKNTLKKVPKSEFDDFK